MKRIRASRVFNLRGGGFGLGVRFRGRVHNSNCSTILTNVWEALYELASKQYRLLFLGARYCAFG